MRRIGLGRGAGWRGQGPRGKGRRGRGRRGHGCRAHGRRARARAALACAGLALLGAAPAAAQQGQGGGGDGAHGADEHAAHASPYAEATVREIKALSPEEAADLRNGEGMGFALAAELNGHPGPRHVLDLASELALTAEQEVAVGRVFHRMRREARALGAAIVEAERGLDRAFAGGVPPAEEVARRAAEIATLRGRLRAVHLVAHLETARLLTAEQRARYATLRGYDGG